jgi:hypothetical protein
LAPYMAEDTAEFLDEMEDFGYDPDEVAAGAR